MYWMLYASEGTAGGAEQLAMNSTCSNRKPQARSVRTAPRQQPLCRTHSAPDHVAAATKSCTSWTAVNLL